LEAAEVMKNIKIAFSGLCLIIFLTLANQAAFPQSAFGKLCGNPAQPCARGDAGFQDNEISFRTPKVLKNLREYASNFFLQ